jgi:two-component system, sensor histidine kinase ChiS
LPIQLKSSDEGRFRLAPAMDLIQATSGASNELPVLDVLIVCRTDYFSDQEIEELDRLFILRITDDWDEANEMMQQNRPQVVLLDRILKDRSGLEVCRAIRQRFSMVQLPVVFLTEVNFAYEMNLFLSVGGNDRIILPSTINDFQSKLLRALRMQELANLSQSREMTFLQSQIKPHFLYNTLNAVISYSYVDQNKSRQMLQLLVEYMQIIFRNENLYDLIPLTAERDLIQAFVQIVSLRMGKTIDFSFELDNELEDILVLPFLIQPIVENACIHGIAKQKDANKIQVSIQDKGSTIRIQVEDDGAGMTEQDIAAIFEKTQVTRGIGLSNLQARLQNKTGKGLHIESRIGQFTRVTYEFPILRLDSQNLT